MGLLADVGAHPVHEEAVVEQGDVEGTAVKGNQSRFFCQQLVEQQEHSWLVAMIAQEILAHHKHVARCAPLKKSHTDHKCQRARPGKPRRFGIDEEEVGEVERF